MTSRKSFKDRVRARMEKTGESYAIAKMRVEEERARLSGDEDVLGAALERDLTAKDVVALEKKLEKRPDDLLSRAKLLGHYMTAGDRAGARSPHVLWVIRERPASSIAGTPLAQFLPGLDPEGLAAASALWREHLEKRGGERAVLANAAKFFDVAKDPLAKELYARLKKLALEEVSRALRRPDDLFDVAAHAMRAGRPAEAVEVFDALFARADPYERWYRLSTAAKAAVEAGASAKAQAWAQELLDGAPAHEKDWNHGNAIHNGNAILGRLALARGDAAEAKRRLLAAGATRGSPQLDSFGPDLTLARALLAAGERDAVIGYLEGVKRFWEMDRGRLEVWIAALARGESPDLRK
jgi:hypothetical protein